jgi:molybdopterin synthase catalytic subunit
VEQTGEPLKTINSLIEAIRSRPDFDKVGMILCHNGVVRGTSRNGRPVSGLQMAINRESLESLLNKYRRVPGIVDIQVALSDKKDLTVGDDVMLLVVAGDIRENVIDTLRRLLDDIKTTVTHKTEFFREDDTL